MDFDFSVGGLSEELSSKKSYEVDERFYVLPKDEKGNGAALIRFLPSEFVKNGSKTEIVTIFKAFKYNIRSPFSKAFYAYWSPSSIGLKDPAQERWAKLWNEGKKDEARAFARQERVIANIQVVNDIKNPENNGKVFLLDMSKTFAQKVVSWADPSAQERALGTTPKEIFNPTKSFLVKYVASVGANGFTNYDKSEVVEGGSPLAATPEEAVKFIQENCYKLSEWKSASAYPSYDEIEGKINNLMTPGGSEPAQTAQTAPAAAAPAAPSAAPFEPDQPAKPTTEVSSAEVSDLDSLIASLS